MRGPRGRSPPPIFRQALRQWYGLRDPPAEERFGDRTPRRDSRRNHDFLFSGARGTLQRAELESNPRILAGDGIQFEEAWKKKLFNWDEIETIKIEKVFFWEVLSLWVNGKKVQNHLSGLKADELALLKQTLLTQAGLRKITIK